MSKCRLCGREKPKSQTQRGKFHAMCGELGKYIDDYESGSKRLKSALVGIKKEINMKIMLDCSPSKIEEYAKRYNYNFGQLRTPLTAYALSGKVYGLDNGCFSKFNKKTWRRLVAEAKENEYPKFVCAPDIVGDARRTLELFDQFYSEISPLPVCLVLQDGIGDFSIDWNRVDAVFVGGSDAFKVSNEAINACKVAKMLDKWVHVGRVNTAQRVSNWIGLADSIDGSGISKYDYMLESVLNEILGNKPQQELI